MSRNSLNIYNTQGQLIAADIQNFNNLEYNRKKNEIGKLVCTLPYGFHEYALAPDNIIEVMRRPFYSRHRYLEGETGWFIRKWEYIVDKNGREFTKVTAHDANDLLSRRIIPYADNSAEADKGGCADDVCKEYVLQNLGTAAGTVVPSYGTITGRDLSSILSIAPDVSLGGSVSIKAAWSDLLPTLQDICAQSMDNFNPYIATAPIWTCFDVVRTEPCKFEFRTYVNYRGVDHSSASGDIRLLGRQYGNLPSFNVAWDYTDEKNYVWCAGQGQGNQRIYRVAYDNARMTKSPWSRNEAYREGQNTDSDTDVSAQADIELNYRRPRVTIDGVIQDTPGFRYGVDYGYGDLLTAHIGGWSFDVHLDSVHISENARGKETLDIQAVCEDFIGL